MHTVLLLHVFPHARRRESLSFIWVIYRHMGERLLTGAEMTQGRYIKKALPSMADSSGKLETWSSLHHLQEAPHTGECPFYIVQLVSVSSRQTVMAPSRHLGRSAPGSSEHLRAPI